MLTKQVSLAGTSCSVCIRQRFVNSPMPARVSHTADWVFGPSMSMLYRTQDVDLLCRHNDMSYSLWHTKKVKNNSVTDELTGLENWQNASHSNTSKFWGKYNILKVILGAYNACVQWTTLFCRYMLHCSTFFKHSVCCFVCIINSGVHLGEINQLANLMFIGPCIIVIVEE
jgi:hypothetical protein